MAQRRSNSLQAAGTAIDVETQTIVAYSAPEADLALTEPVNYCGYLHIWFSNGGYGKFVGGPQTDGTREFGTPNPTADTTWGQIKALYR